MNNIVNKIKDKLSKTIELFIDIVDLFTPIEVVNEKLPKLEIKVGKRMKNQSIIIKSQSYLADAIESIQKMFPNQHLSMNKVNALQEFLDTNRDFEVFIDKDGCMCVKFVDSGK